MPPDVSGSYISLWLEIPLRSLSSPSSFSFSSVFASSTTVSTIVSLSVSSSFSMVSYSGSAVCIFQENLNRHERAVLLDDFSCAVLVGRTPVLSSFKIKDNLGTTAFLVALIHLKLSAALRLPVNRLCAFLIGKGIDRNLVRYHECRIETQTEMTDDLVFVCFVLIFLPGNPVHRKMRSG